MKAIIMITRNSVAMILSYYVLLVLLSLLNGASGRLVKTSIKRQQSQRQPKEFQHRKLVKLFGEDGTTSSADRIDGKYIVVLNEQENLDSFLDSLKRKTMQTRTAPLQQIQIQHEYRHAMVGFSAEIFSQHALHALLEDERVQKVAEVRYIIQGAMDGFPHAGPLNNSLLPHAFLRSWWFSLIFSSFLGWTCLCRDC
jgi:Peptidase inhibitor I9